jgi:hypothetical protein
MGMLSSADVRRSLVERIASRLAGQGISRGEVESAVARVATALADAALAPRLLVAVAARSVPDLASRLQRDLEHAGVVIEEMGVGAAGRHTVVMVRIAASAREVLVRTADRSGFSLSILDLADV